jgi:hypothetical protein
MTTIRRTLVLGIAALALVGVASLAFAQDDVLEANIPFAFHVNSKTFPAGQYEMRIDWADRRVTVIGGQHAPAIELFVTTLAPSPHTTVADTRVVFDKVGTTYTLSELWAPNVDGILLHATEGKHEHEVLHVHHRGRD